MSPAHEELGGLSRPDAPDEGTFFGGGVKLLADWDCPPGRGSALFQEIVQYFRRSGWREPPVGSGSEEWRRRVNYRLPPERVQEHARRVRDQLNASSKSSAVVGPASAMGAAPGEDSEAQDAEAEGTEARA